MFVPALADLYVGHPDWQVFALSGALCGGVFMLTAAATSGPPPVFTRRFGFLLVNVLWTVFTIVGAIPFYLSSYDLTLAQAVFESVSGITTTGGTVLVGLDNLPPGLLLWRSLIVWLGGIGILGLGLFILPNLRVGGLSFFKLESSDTTEKPFSRFASFTRAFMAIYLGITLACTLAYAWAGMSLFDAVNHALTTVATGGYSTHDASFGHFDSLAVLWAGTIFMTISSLPFSVMILLAVRKRLNVLRDPQILAFLGYLTVFSVAVGVYHHLTNDVEIGLALTHAFFNISSILSTTGFASEDYTLWGPFAVTAAFMATFIGGCTGSTAGGIKAYRIVVLYGVVRAGLQRLVYPSSVASVRYGRQTVEPDVQRSIFLFLALYMLLWALGLMALGALGYDLMTAMSGSITSLSNVGPGIGSIIGPAGNFSTISDPALYVMSVLMLLGRLEVLTVLVLLMPTFWRY
ncbi:potassium transporter [Pseudorhizobium endolithicum]|uniref:Trk system potassium uptake protein n=2 Tax=Pseudorhizobium endolithicum TaxID=1191678 RepID=A0ABN7JHQ9_9HYPH|nr:potassium transporter [Pseudorhizobium endolithicum]